MVTWVGVWKQSHMIMAMFFLKWKPLNLFSDLNSNEYLSVLDTKGFNIKLHEEFIIWVIFAFYFPLYVACLATAYIVYCLRRMLSLLKCAQSASIFIKQSYTCITGWFYILFCYNIKLLFCYLSLKLEWYFFEGVQQSSQGAGEGGGPWLTGGCLVLFDWLKVLSVDLTCLFWDILFALLRLFSALEFLSFS